VRGTQVSRKSRSSAGRNLDWPLASTTPIHRRPILVTGNSSGIQDAGQGTALVLMLGEPLEGRTQAPVLPSSKRLPHLRRGDAQADPDLHISRAVWYGDIVRGSMLMYGSSLRMLTGTLRKQSKRTCDTPEMSLHDRAKMTPRHVPRMILCGSST
jgi:hypothetical protein